MAQLCLDQFDLMRKSNLVVLQCAFFMRLYQIFAPEDGDGADGGVFSGVQWGIGADGVLHGNKS